MKGQSAAAMECTDKPVVCVDSGKGIHEIHNSKPAPSVVFAELDLMAEEFFANQVKAFGDSADDFGLYELQMFVKALLDVKGINIKQFENNTPDIVWVHSFIKRHRHLLPSQMCENILTNQAAVNLGTGGALTTSMKVDFVQNTMSHTETVSVVKLEKEEESIPGEQMKDIEAAHVGIPEKKLEREDVNEYVLVETGLVKVEKEHDSNMVNDTEHIVVPSTKDENIAQVGLTDVTGSGNVSGEQYDPLESASCDTEDFKCEDEFLQEEEMVSVDMQIKAKWSSDEETQTNVGKQGLKRKCDFPSKDPHKVIRLPDNSGTHRRKPGRPRKINRKKNAPEAQPVDTTAISVNSMQPSKKSDERLTGSVCQHPGPPQMKANFTDTCPMASYGVSGTLHQNPPSLSLDDASITVVDLSLDSKRRRAVDRSRLVGMYKAGYSITKISRELGVTRSTVRRWLNRWKESQDLQDRPRTGRPRKTGDNETSRMLADVEQYPFTNAVAMKERLNLTVSPRTIRRRLREVGIYHFDAGTKQT